MRTTPLSLPDFIQRMDRALRCTACRHLRYTLDTVEGQHARIDRIAQNPHSRDTTFLPADVDTDQIDHRISFSVPSRIGTMMRKIWGPHPIINVVFTSNINIDDYLPETLKAFDTTNPSMLTRFKRDVIFCKPVQRFLRHGLAKMHTQTETFRECDAPGMISANVLYNIVLTHDSFRVMSNKVWSSVIDWVLSKHVLVAGKYADVRFAGEMWKTPDDVIHINRNSGTYQPSQLQLEQVVKMAHVILPNLKFQVADFELA